LRYFGHIIRDKDKSLEISIIEGTLPKKEKSQTKNSMDKQCYFMDRIEASEAI